MDNLRGVIFRVPMVSAADDAGVYVTADEYLSGNVRDKLRIARLAAQQDSTFAINVEALEKAQPKDLEASEIDVRLGATWISADIIKQFSRELFGLPFYLDRTVKIHYSPHTAEWRIEGKSSAGVGNVSVNMTYGTDRANGFRILEDTLNLRDVRIYDTVEDADGSTKRVLNQRETTLAQQKQQAIKDAFQDWIWKDPQRRHDLVKKYNELFNSTRPREYDGSHIVFSGMNPEISLREHQRNAIAHVLYGGNTLLAHEVGAGKTYEMAAAAMESKRLGLCHKSMFVVPNHLTEQWASEFLRLYPGANILVTTKKDFEKANRKKLCARIATGDYDAIIIGHSQFERIPISTERQQRIIQQQIDEITEGIEETKSQNGERFTIKQLEKTRKSLEARLEKLLAEDKKDDVVTFEELGVDRLFVDEAHAYKNLFLYTKMRNVAGLSTSEAQLAKTITYLSEHGFSNVDELRARADEASASVRDLLEQSRALDGQMKEAAEMRNQVICYMHTKDVFAEYKRLGYPRAFLEAHEAEIAMQREAKRYFNEHGMKKLPSGHALKAEVERLKAEKAQSYQAYRTARDEMRELLVVRENVERILREDTDRENIKEKTRTK